MLPSQSSDRDLIYKVSAGHYFKGFAGSLVRDTFPSSVGQHMQLTEGGSSFTSKEATEKPFPKRRQFVHASQREDMNRFEVVLCFVVVVVLFWCVCVCVCV